MRNPNPKNHMVSGAVTTPLSAEVSDFSISVMGGLLDELSVAMNQAGMVVLHGVVQGLWYRCECVGGNCSVLVFLEPTHLIAYRNYLAQKPCRGEHLQWLAATHKPRSTTTQKARERLRKLGVGRAIEVYRFKKFHRLALAREFDARLLVKCTKAAMSRLEQSVAESA